MRRWILVLLITQSACSFFKPLAQSQSPGTFVYHARNSSCGAAITGEAFGRLMIEANRVSWKFGDDAHDRQAYVTIEQQGTYRRTSDALILSLGEGKKEINYPVIQKTESETQPSRTLELWYVPKYDGFFFTEDLKHISDPAYVWYPDSCQLRGPDCHLIGYFCKQCEPDPNSVVTTGNPLKPQLIELDNCHNSDSQPGYAIHPLNPTRLSWQHFKPGLYNNQPLIIGSIEIVFYEPDGWYKFPAKTNETSVVLIAENITDSTGPPFPGLEPGRKAQLSLVSPERIQILTTSLNILNK